jgi:hypothetical protein
MSNKTIVLPSGATVDIRDAATIKQGDRRKVYAVINPDISATDLKAGMQVIDAVMAVMIESWSLDLLPPSVKLESLDELTLADYDKLQDEATEYMKVLFPALSKTVETEADPKALTVNSND